MVFVILKNENKKLMEMNFISVNKWAVPCLNGAAGYKLMSLLIDVITYLILIPPRKNFQLQFPVLCRILFQTCV